MPWLAAGAIAVGSGIASYLANSSANDRAAMIQHKNFQNWMNLNIPDPAAQKIALQNFVSAGTLTPEMQHAIAQDPSAMDKIVTGVQTQSAQNRALSELSDIGNQGGLRLQDKAALQDATLRTQAQERANREGIAANMAQRGLGGSGYEVAAQLQGQQGVSDQNARNSLTTAAQAQDRALQAIEGAGGLATQYRSQQFGEDAAKAQAQDAISRFNTQNLRDVNASNTAAQNYTNQLNLANLQDIHNKNTALANQQEVYNKQLPQQQFQNEVQQLSGAQGSGNDLAATTQRGGALAGNTISNIGGAATNAYSANDNRNFWANYFNKGNNSTTPTTSTTGDSNPGGSSDFNLGTYNYPVPNSQGLYTSY